MPTRPTEYHRPKSLDEALKLLAGPTALPLGGGTKLLAGEFDGAVVDLQDLGIDQIRREAGRLNVGAMTRLTALQSYLSSTEMDADKGGGSNPAPLLSRATHRAGPNTYRNAATIGGSVAARLGDSELLAALLVLEAELFLAGSAVTRLPLSQYLLAEKAPAGLITALDLDWKPGHGVSERVARTPADTPIVSITLWRPSTGRPRLAATGLDSRPIRLVESEEALTGQPGDDAVSRAAELARDRCRHPGDFRGSAAYRAEMAAVLTRRVLNS